ncbi:hypothetical protein WMF18_21015 [Sorangium sp. So ce315]|uniref:hypothetical protein n=1 Tax=Sorangium sp. So ce315 TaxID=3133299 RepID=UPI003F61A3D0
MLLLLGASILISSRTAMAAQLTCSASATLEDLTVCIRDQMPRRDSGSFVVPSFTQVSAWRSVVRAMIRGTCNTVLPSSLSSFMRIRSLRDAANGRRYCVLMETGDQDEDGFVDRGTGTFIVDAAARRELNHTAPHPISDMRTETEAVTIFKETRSRSLLVAGTHRDASLVVSDCQSSTMLSDVAHNVANMFHATHLELAAHYGPRPWWVISWHGMAEDTCPAVDVHLSHGMDVVPVEGDRALALRNNLRAYHPGWRIGVPGRGMCSLNGTTNVQGRFLNGVPASGVCGSPAARYTGRFVHIEQDPAFRDPDSWIAAVMDTWR